MHVRFRDSILKRSAFSANVAPAGRPGSSNLPFLPGFFFPSGSQGLKLRRRDIQIYFQASVKAKRTQGKKRETILTGRTIFYNRQEVQFLSRQAKEHLKPEDERRKQEKQIGSQEEWPTHANLTTSAFRDICSAKMCGCKCQLPDYSVVKIDKFPPTSSCVCQTAKNLQKLSNGLKIF